MNLFKSFTEFLTESYLIEFKEDKEGQNRKTNEALENKKSKISDELDMPQRHDWSEKIIKREYNKENNDSWNKAEEEAKKKSIEIEKEYEKFKKDGNLPEEKKEEMESKMTEAYDSVMKPFINKVKNDPKYGPEYSDYISKNKRYSELSKKSNDTGGWEKFEKNNKKEFDELIDLQYNHMSGGKLTKRPGGILQITSQDMDGGEEETELAAEAFRRKMKDYIDKNGKPKGVIMDLRSNTGGSQETAKGMVDFFVDQNKYTIEKQKYAVGVRRYRDLPYPEALNKALEYTDEKKITDYVNSLSEKEKKEYWEQSSKDGDFSYQNDRENKVESKYRLSGIPTVVQTSVRTFSAGEFATDSVKNLNPNVVHIGHNTGGGANQTGGAYEADEWDNKDRSSTDKAKIVARAFKNGYWDEKKGKDIHDAIMKQIDSGEINDKLSMEDICKVTKKTAIAETGDAHIDVTEDEDRPGSVFAAVPQVKSDRVKVDPKTKKPILKDGKMEFSGNWEQTGVGSSNTSAFIESDPDSATKDALEYLYKKNGDKKLLEELKEDPSKFGLTKDGKDGIFDTDSKSKQSAFVIGGDERQAKQLEDSKKVVKENEKNQISISDTMIKAESKFKRGSEDEKTLEKTHRIYSGFEELEVKKIKDMEIPITKDGNKKSTIQFETLMDFIPVDLKDPKDELMVKYQMKQYEWLNKIRIKNKLKGLIEYKDWLERNIELAKDNKDYQARIKAKKLKKESYNNLTESTMKHIKTFESFLNEAILAVDSLIEKPLSIEIGSGTTSGTFSRDELIEKIEDAIKHNLFDSEFYYNWTDNGNEYKKVFNKDTLNPIMKNEDKALKDYFVLKGNKLVFNIKFDNAQQWIDNWFKTNKSISQSLRKEYYDYREKYAGVKL